MFRSMLLRTLLLAAIAALTWPCQADAQIYAWRDARGNLVLSDRRLDAGAVTYAVPNAPTLRSTRPAAPGAMREQFEPLVQEHATRHSLRPDLVRAVIQVESGFNPRATSSKGAMGLMQLMPGTARQLGVRNAYDPSENIRGGTAYLRQLLDRYDGNEELALAAYNAGPGAVDRHGRQVPPYGETATYVRKVGSAAEATPGSRPASARRVIYKTLEIINGEPVARYSTQPPAAGSYQILER
ncbi:MAG: lytic transglycosylase domain-containing protein [Acidobacteria bacterium]|nr:lytic transglycosylase domain-containing protein [Acidobacteriota bacterium]